MEDWQTSWKLWSELDSQEYKNLLNHYVISRPVDSCAAYMGAPGFR